jgi:hypothetical protein
MSSGTDTPRVLTSRTRIASEGFAFFPVSSFVRYVRWTFALSVSSPCVKPVPSRSSRSTRLSPGGQVYVTSSHIVKDRMIRGGVPTSGLAYGVKERCVRIAEALQPVFVRTRLAEHGRTAHFPLGGRRASR